MQRVYEDFAYQAQSWGTPCRVIAQIEWYPGELFPRVGLIVTNMPMEPDWMVRSTLATIRRRRAPQLSAGPRF